MIASPPMPTARSANVAGSGTVTKPARAGPAESISTMRAARATKTLVDLAALHEGRAAIPFIDAGAA
jgi:hypothetical protein